MVELPRFDGAAVEAAGAAADVEGWEADVAAGLVPRPEKRELVGAGALVVVGPELVAVAVLAAGAAVDAAVGNVPVADVVGAEEGLPRLENKEGVAAALVVAGPCPEAGVPPGWFWPMLENRLLIGAAEVVVGVPLAPPGLNKLEAVPPLVEAGCEVPVCDVEDA